jgi:hypothetical protein
MHALRAHSSPSVNLVKMNLEKAAIYLEMAKQLLEDAREVCKQPFQNAES